MGEAALDTDPWRQWQAFAQRFAPSGQSGGARAGTAGFAPFIEAADQFAAAAKSFFEGSRAAPAAAAAAQSFSDFLRDQFAPMFQPPWTGAAGFASSPPPPPPFMADAPALGLTREYQERAQRAAEALRRLDEAQRRLQRLWSDTLRDAAAAFAARLGPPQPAALSPEALHRLYDTWIDCAEQAYARTAHGEAFCDALADYVNASSHWRREASASVEDWAKLLDLPTRSEINSLAERLQSLEVQLRELRAAQKPRAEPRKPRQTPRKVKP
jgi:class III poly(R)-hydroxyalkanoic acid synthase PhaE subunit